MPRLVYGRCFIPPVEPVDVRKGERIALRLRASKVRDDAVAELTVKFSD